MLGVLGPQHQGPQDDPRWVHALLKLLQRLFPPIPWHGTEGSGHTLLSSKEPNHDEVCDSFEGLRPLLGRAKEENHGKKGRGRRGKQFLDDIPAV